ncbi:Putative hydrolase YcgS [Durusdinium trenchii]|uniref:Hydrolase YcgS n=1 Tax=Durusdinium trenchii TaxID=1381693 RepID=A0ABP0IW85_9DINO
MGRHGLRCRHLMGRAAKRSAELVEDMTLEEILRIWQGLLRFSRDHRSVFIKARPRIQRQLPSMSIKQLILVLRCARDLRRNMAELHGATCAMLLPHVAQLTPSEGAHCLSQCAYTDLYRAQVFSLVRAIAEDWTTREELSSQRLVEAVDALECLASWNLRPVELLGRLDGLLVERQVELKYTGNVMLWVTATCSLASLEYRPAAWPLLALQLASDKIFLEQVPLYGHCELLRGFLRLGLFEATAFQNFAELLLAEKQHFRDVKDIAAVVTSFAQLRCLHSELFDTLYKMTLDMSKARAGFSDMGIAPEIVPGFTP